MISAAMNRWTVLVVLFLLHGRCFVGFAGVGVVAPQMHRNRSRRVVASAANRAAWASVRTDVPSEADGDVADCDGGCAAAVVGGAAAVAAGDGDTPT